MHAKQQNFVCCSICRAIVYKGHYVNVDSDGLYCEGDCVVCEACLPHATLGDDRLRVCLKEAIVGTHEALGIKIEKLSGVRYMKRKEIWSIRRHKTVVEGLPNYYSLGIASTSGIIVLRPGIHRETAIVTLVHELAHIWQYENWPHFRLLEKYQIEGFAEWVGYKVALSLGLFTEAQGLLMNGDPVYGGGLRYVLNTEAKFGKAFVLAGFHGQ